MNITIITPYMEPQEGACTIRVNWLDKILTKHNHKVTVLKQSSAVTKVIDSKPNMIIATSPPLQPNLKFLLLSKALRIPFILDAKDDGQFYVPNENALKRNMYLQIRKLVYENSNKLIFLTEADKEEARKNYRVPDKKCFVVPNGTDTEKIKPTDEMRKQTRERLGIKNETVLVYSGSIGDENISGFLSNVGKTILKNKMRLILVLAVDRTKEDLEEFNKIEKVIEELNLSSSLNMFINVKYDSIVTYYSAGDIGIVPWDNAFVTSVPVKTFDYCASGLIVLAKTKKKSELYKTIDYHEVGFCVETWKDFNKELDKFKNMNFDSYLFWKKQKNRWIAIMTFNRDLHEKKLLEVLK